MKLAQWILVVALAFSSFAEAKNYRGEYTPNGGVSKYRKGDQVVVGRMKNGHYNEVKINRPRFNK